LVAAVEGVCAGAGAILAMASDLRIAAPDAKTAFLFTRVGLSGADMGACAILPRIIGHGRAADLLFTGRSMSAEEGFAWGFWNRLSDIALADAQALARELAAGLEQWCEAVIHDAEASDVDYACRATVAELGKAGFLKLCVGEADRRPDVRSLAICRETFARYHGLVDFAFAMQGLGSGAISLFGTVEQKRAWLPRVAAGEAIAAFAMTEPECGSDAANMVTSAMRDGNEWVLIGEKTYI